MKQKSFIGLYTPKESIVECKGWIDTEKGMGYAKLGNIRYEELSFVIPLGTRIFPYCKKSQIIFVHQESQVAFDISAGKGAPVIDEKMKAKIDLANAQNLWDKLGESPIDNVKAVALFGAGIGLGSIVNLVLCYFMGFFA